MHLTDSAKGMLFEIKCTEMQCIQEYLLHLDSPLSCIKDPHHLLKKNKLFTSKRALLYLKFQILLIADSVTYQKRISRNAGTGNLPCLVLSLLITVYCFGHPYSSVSLPINLNQYHIVQPKVLAYERLYENDHKISNLYIFQSSVLLTDFYVLLQTPLLACNDSVGSAETDSSLYPVVSKWQVRSCGPCRDL